MNDSTEGRRLHGFAEEARESGDFLKALEYTDQATLAYQKDGDVFGLAEVQSSRQSTFKHLYRKTGDSVFLTLEKHAAQSAVEIAEKSGQPEAVGIPYHNLGKYYFEVKEYKKAVEAFRKAVENLEAHTDNRHSRPSVIADIKGHLAAAEYHAGDRNALEGALAALTDLQNSTDNWDYNMNAWISGAHLRIAEMLRHDNPDLAHEHLKKAEEIITGDTRQVLRKEQLEKLKQTF